MVARRREIVAAPAGEAARDAGFSLVLLVMTVTVLSIMLAAALPQWSDLIRRDKEEELISRGFQYAEAIRVFQRRFQRLPTSLDELVKVKPRCIRQLWTDPMTQNGKWTVIFLNQGSPLTPVAGLNPNQTQTGSTTPQPPNPTAQPPGNGLDPGGQEVTLGPIVGVHSRSTDKSLLVFFGHEHYNEWEFRVDMLSRMQRQVAGVGIGAGGGGLTLSTRWLGRPIENFAPTGNGLQPSALGPAALPGSASGAPPGPGSATAAAPPPPPTGMPPG